MKTSELTGAALDWAVAKCEGATNLRKNPHRFDCRWIVDMNGSAIVLNELPYSSEWARGGPIIEREEISVIWQGNTWIASKFDAKVTGNYFFHQSGETLLIAAMRSHVAITIGDEVEIPKELQA